MWVDYRHEVVEVFITCDSLALLQGSVSTHLAYVVCSGASVMAISYVCPGYFLEFLLKESILS